MEIAEGMEIRDLALYIQKQEALVIGDVHLGYEEEQNKRGVLLPRFQLKDTIERLHRIYSQLKKEGKKVKETVVNGDLKHEFGAISQQEWREILKLIDFMLENSERTAIIKGNHDPMLFPIARKRNIELQEHHFKAGIYVTHGHRIPEDSDFRKAKTIIIGNEHPAVSIREGARNETFKCFLKGKWKGKALIAMPSFNVITTGTDITREKPLSPFLHQSLADFEVYVAADEAYYFGKLRNLK